MSENPTDPRTPDPAADPAAETEVLRAEETRTTEPAAEAPAPRRRKALWIGGGIAAAAVLVGGGVAAGALLGDDWGDNDDDDRRTSAVTGDDQRGAGDDRDDDDRGASAAPGAPAASVGAASIDELLPILTAATAAAEGEPVSIEAEDDGAWDVTLAAADGAETEVRVAADGTATVRDTDAADADDRAPQKVLDETTLRTIVEAALADTAGRVVDVDADDDGQTPYDVSILTGDGTVVQVELAADGTVVRSALDD